MLMWLNNEINGKRHNIPDRTIERKERHVNIVIDNCITILLKNNIKDRQLFIIGTAVVKDGRRYRGGMGKVTRGPHEMIVNL